MKILFINGSPNKKGNTAALASALGDAHDFWQGFSALIT